MRFLVLAAAVASLVFAGCLGASQGPLAAEVPAPAAAAQAGALQEFPWEGHVLVGAAFEVPAHFNPPESAVAPVWTSGVVLQVDEVPEDMQVALDWTGTLAEIQLMAHAPHSHDGDNGWPEYVTPFSSDAHQCFRIPAKDLQPGPWYLMVHTHYGAQVDFTITALLRGGAAHLADGPHGHATGPEELQNLAKTLVYTAPVVGHTRATKACDPAQ